MATANAIEAARLMLRLRTGEDQAQVYARLAELGPVHVMPWKAVVVTGYELCREVLGDPSYATLDAGWRDRLSPGWRANRSLVTFHTSLIAMKPPQHTALRKVLTSELSPQAVAALRPRVAAAIDHALEELATMLAGGSTVDLVAGLAATLPIEILCIWLGLSTEDAARLARITRRWSVAYEIGPSPAELADADEAHGMLCDYLLPHLERRRHTPGDDTLSRWLMPAPHGGGLDIPTVLASTALAFLGAKDLTSLTTSAVHALLTDPTLPGRLRQDATAAVEDIARLSPAIAVLVRVATRDMLLGGVAVEAGSLVHTLLQPANRDPSRGNSILSFGTGIHYCAAASLNRLTLQLLLPLMADRFPALRLASTLPKSEGVVFPHLARLLASEQPGAAAALCPHQRTTKADSPVPWKA